MAIKLEYGGNHAYEWPAGMCTLRPAPFVSIQTDILKNGAGVAFGVAYQITLQGTLLSDEGTPFARSAAPFNPSDPNFDNSTVPFSANLYNFKSTPPGLPDSPDWEEASLCGPYKQFQNVLGQTFDSWNGGYPPGQYVPVGEQHNALLSKQNALKSLFAVDGNLLEISDWREDHEVIHCYPRLVSISFDQGVYVNKCEYTITLEADTLIYPGNGPGGGEEYVAEEGTLGITSGVLPKTHGLSLGATASGVTEADLVNEFNKYFIGAFSEDWGLEVEDGQGQSPELPKKYMITHNLSATGKTHHKSGGADREAWEEAKGFVQSRLKDSIVDYPNQPLGAGALNLGSEYGGYNLSRTESIGESEGTYQISETWLVSSGTAFETFSTSISSSNTAAAVSVSIDGTITGLSNISPSGYPVPSANRPYAKALEKYYEISKSGTFGIGSTIYKRANSLVAVELNSQPLSTTIGTNEYDGEITYSLSFDNRPVTIISGVLTESIDVNDTYPGDTFAVIPVLGRKQGPVLQYTGSRTEYKRDLTVALQLDYTDLHYGSGRNLLLRKPSVVEPYASQLAELITSVSPKNEPGVRKWFISPPTERWNPKTGAYNLTINWTYELDK